MDHLKVNGVVRATAFIQFSDIRLKANIQDLTDAVNIVSKLQGKTYTWKKNDQFDNQKGGKRVIGLIAQEVQKVAPEVVHEDPETGLLAVSYSELVPILIEAFKQLMHTYQEDKEEVHGHMSQLQNKLDKMATEIAVLEEQQHSLLQRADLYGSPDMTGDKEKEESSNSSNGSAGDKMEEENLKDKNTFYITERKTKRNTMKLAVVVTFLLGIAISILGVVLLTNTLVNSYNIVTTSVLAARDLKHMDEDGVPDPFVQVTCDEISMYTDTLWNQFDPLWESTFDYNVPSSMMQDPTQKIVYQVWDNQSNSDPPLRIGVCYLYLDTVTPEMPRDEWLTLVPNLEGDQVSGELHVTASVQQSQGPGYELAVLCVGVLLTAISLFAGFYVWKIKKSA